MLLWKFHSIACRVNHYILVAIYRGRFARYGSHFHFDPSGRYSYENIYCGDFVSLGIRPELSATRSKIIIGNHVMFGPEVKIYGGNHRIDIVGRYMDSISENEKKPTDDQNVMIEDDVWVGARSIILKGVTIGRGSVIAAGSVVNKDVPRYSIVGGVPAKVMRYRWNSETIKQHEKILYSIIEKKI